MYIKKTIANKRRRIPSIRETTFEAAPSKNISLERSTRRRVVSMTRGRSIRRVERASVIGMRIAVIQSMRSMFAIFEPITFPSAIS